MLKGTFISSFQPKQSSKTTEIERVTDCQRIRTESIIKDRER